MNTGRVHVGFVLAVSALALFVLAAAIIGQQQPNPDLGFTDTPILPGAPSTTHPVSVPMSPPQTINPILDHLISFIKFPSDILNLLLSSIKLLSTDKLV